MRMNAFQIRPKDSRVLGRKRKAAELGLPEQITRELKFSKEILLD